MCIITFSWSTTVAKLGGPMGPFRLAMDTLVGLNCISALAVVFIVAMCVNSNKLTKSLTSQNQQKKPQWQIWNPTPMWMCTHTNKQTPFRKKRQEHEEHNFVSTSSWWIIALT